MADILNSGRNKIALQQGNSQPLNVAKFVFANIPGLVVTDPVNLAQGMPVAGNIVYQKAKSAQGYVASDQVVYSVILTPDEGNFNFNWVGLVDADNELIAVSYTPLQNKYKTVGLNVGNTLTRNFLLKFNNAQAITGINVAAQTWQIDFTGWLSSVDETIRADMRDVFGVSRFLGNGMQVVVNGAVVSAKAGVGYVGGYRAVLAADTVVNAGALPKDIYIDCMLDGGLSGSTVISTLRASAPGVPLTDFTDSNNKKHYVVKIASISVTSVVTDLRKTLPNNSALIDYLTDQLALKAPISSPAFTDIPTAPTAAPGTSTKQLSTTEFVITCVTNAINSLVAAAPGTLNTLNEIALALGNDPNFATTMLNSLAAKAAINSPVFTGTPTAPTAAPGTNTKQLSTTEFVNTCVSTAINTLVAAAPGALDTLNEIAVALGNDPNFATTMINALAAKAAINSPAFAGIPTAPTAAAGTNNQQLSNTAFVVAAITAAVNALATVARTGSAADLTGVLAAARLPFSYGTPMTAGMVAQRDGGGHLLVPDVPLNESGAKAANTNFVISCVNAAIAALIASAPTTLNTLDELAAALGDDPNFATTIINLIAAKAPTISPAFTGNPTAPTAAVETNNNQLATTAFAQLVAGLKMSRSPSATLIHSGGTSALSVSGYQDGFYVVYTNAPSGANGWMGNGAIIYKGAMSTQTVFAANNNMMYVATIAANMLRAFSVNTSTGVETAISINYVYKIG